MKRLEPYRTVKPLYKMMIDRELTWKDINKNIKIQPDQLYKLQKGHVPPQYLIDRLCAYLQCKEEDIIGWEV